jgi:hypothetical protein
MSRIDDALKRLAGVVPPESRTLPMLERYASEARPRVDDSKKPTRVEEHKVASFVAPGPRPLEGRPTAAKSIAAATSRTARPEPTADPESNVEAEPLIEVRQFIDYAGFVWRSVGRHKLLAAATIALVLTMTGAALVLLPRTYHVQTKLLAQRNAMMTALSNPGRAVPWDADAPTRAAAETVLRRDNLISLITKTDLMREWERTRAPILKLKDWVVATVNRYTLTPDDKLEALIGTLEKRMVVEAGPIGEGAVTIDLDWPDAEMAFRLVEAAQQAFLEARQAAETAAIGESIAILERYSASLHEDVNRTLTELRRTQAKAAPAGGPRRRVSTRPLMTAGVPSLAASLGVPELDDTLDITPDLSRLKGTLTAKKAELGRLEENRERQLSELQGRLSQLKTVYTANHPSVLSMQQNVLALSQDPPQAVALSAEIEELQAELDQQMADATDLQIKAAESARRSAAAAPRAAVAAPADETVERAPEPALPVVPQAGEFASLRLRSELTQLGSVLERTDAARIELAVSQAAFKYRYTVIRPAQVPKDPVFPNFKLVMATGILASLMLALAAVVAKDLLSNRILEPWQIERQLGLPVLGTLRTA